MTGQQEHETKLDWLAFRFVAGEMDSQQEEDFCERMAQEQPVREAVAEAVQLTQAIALAESAELVAPRGKQQARWMQSGVWMAMGGVCCLVLVVLFQALNPSDEPRGSGSLLNGSALNRSAATHALAVAWSETRLQWPADEMSGEEEDDDLLEDETALLLAQDDEAISAPTWILAAVGASIEQLSPPDEGGAHHRIEELHN